MMLDPLEAQSLLPGTAGELARGQLGRPSWTPDPAPASAPVDALPDLGPEPIADPIPAEAPAYDFTNRRRTNYLGAEEHHNRALAASVAPVPPPPAPSLDAAGMDALTGLFPPVAATSPRAPRRASAGLSVDEFNPAPNAVSRVTPASVAFSGADAVEADRLQRLDRTKAAAYGVGRGAAFLAGAPAGAGIGSEIGAWAGGALGSIIPGAGTVAGAGVGAAAGGVIGGLITGTAAAWGADKGARLLAEHFDTVRGFTRAADEHPVAAGMGEIVTGLSGVPRAATQAIGAGIRSVAGEGPGVLARAGGAVAKGYEASGGGAVETVANLSREAGEAAARGESVSQIAAPIVARVGAAAGGVALLNTALKTAAHAAGYSDGGQTLGGAAQAALLGAFAAGHGLRYAEYNPAAVGDILLRAKVRGELNLPLTQGNLREGRLPGEWSMDSARAAELRRPLTAREAELYTTAREGLAAALAGEAPPPPNGPARVQGRATPLLPFPIGTSSESEEERRRRQRQPLTPIPGWNGF